MKKINQQLLKLISDDKPLVYALRGNWGVGKTFLWNKFIDDNKDSLKFDNYSYVSLFGINSIESLKNLIFENTIKKSSIGANPNLGTFKENSENFFTKLFNKEEREEGFFYNIFHKYSNVSDKIPFLKDYSSSFDSLKFMSISNTLICIDDIERRKKDLDIKEIFGLCNLLKEQKNCKVLIILNDTEEQLSDYKKYREKIIDADILLNPSTKECNEIVFNNDKKYSELKDFCISLNITNIRILKKIKQMYDEIIETKIKLHHEILINIELSLALFMLCFYTNNESIPDFEYVKKNTFLKPIDDKLEDGIKNKFQNWNNFINSLGYLSTDKLDLTIARFVEQGFIEKDALKTIVEIKTKEIESQEKSYAFNEAMNKYKYSFNEKTNDLINNVIKSFKENINDITRSRLDEVIIILRQLKKDKIATELIDLWIEKHQDNYECYNLSENIFSTDISDNEIIQKFNDIYKEYYFGKEKSKEKIIEKIKAQQGLDETDLFVFSELTIEELVSIIKSLQPTEMKKYITLVLACKNIDDWRKNIYIKNIEALKSIRKEDPENESRLKNLGIDLSL